MKKRPKPLFFLLENRLLYCQARNLQRINFHKLPSTFSNQVRGTGATRFKNTKSSFEIGLTICNARALIIWTLGFWGLPIHSYRAQWSWLHALDVKFLIWSWNFKSSCFKLKLFCRQSNCGISIQEEQNCAKPCWQEKSGKLVCWVISGRTASWLFSFDAVQACLL